MIKYARVFLFVLSCGASLSFASTQSRIVILANLQLDLSKGIQLNQVIDKSKTTVPIAELEQISLVPPTNKNEIVLSSLDISSIVRPIIQQLELSLNQKIQLQIPASLFVTQIRQALDKEKIQKLLIAQMVLPCQSCFYTIEEVKIPTVPLRYQNVPWQVRLVNPSPRGQFNFELYTEDVQSSKTWGSTKFWGTGYARLNGKVAILKNTKEVGEKVTLADVEFVERNLTFLRGAPVTEEYMKGSILKQTKNAQEVLVSEDFTRKLAIKKNETIKVNIGEKSWQISLSGIAQSSGYVGDKIEVMNPSSKKIFTAEVIEDGTVRVE